VLVDACGLAAFERAVFVDEMLERQGRNARFWVEVQAGSKGVDATAQQTSDRIACLCLITNTLLSTATCLGRPQVTYSNRERCCAC
jgi:hypothetical protein